MGRYRPGSQPQSPGGMSPMPSKEEVTLCYHASTRARSPVLAECIHIECLFSQHISMSEMCPQCSFMIWPCVAEKDKGPEDPLQ